MTRASLIPFRGWSQGAAILLMSMGLISGCGHSAPTSPPELLPSHTFNADPAWSPSGHRIAFVHYAQTVEESALGLRQIWYYDETTGVSTYIAPGVEPDWCGSDSVLIFDDTANIYRYDLTTGAITTLVSCNGINQQPAVSPDGQWLAFTSDCSIGTDPTLDIWLFNLTTGRDTCISTTDNGSWTYPAWSSDGTKIAHVRYSGTHHASELFIMDMDGQNAVQVRSEFQSDDRQAAWSRKGDWIYYTKVLGPVSEAGIWRVRPDASDASLIIPGGSNASSSPEDSTLIFTMYDTATNSYDIWKSAPDGTGRSRMALFPVSVGK